jgi:chemotaxis protein MotB
MSDENSLEQIVIRKSKHDEDEDHHGGVWKLAFADFMTALMAFFLVMWLINSTSKETKASIVQYFNPVQLIDATPNQKGMRDPADNGRGKSPQQTDFSESVKEGEEHAGAGDSEAKEEALHKEPMKVLEELAKLETPRQEGEAPAATPAPSAALSDPFERMDETAARARAARGKQASTPRSQAEENAGGGKAAPEAARRASATPEQGAKDAAARAAALKAALEKVVSLEMKGGRGALQATVTQTEEGLLISLTDSANFSMFDVGSIEPKPQLVRILAEIGKMLSKLPGDIEIRGHTDSRSYKSKSYDNWRLSCDRANLANYMLLRGGLSPVRVKRISGYADRQLKAPNDPEAAINRRIEILVKGDGR